MPAGRSPTASPRAIRPAARVVVVAGPATTAATASSPPAFWPSADTGCGVLLVGDLSRLKGDAALAAQRWPGPSEPAAPAGAVPADVVIDALFGAGLDRPVEGAARAMIEAMNAGGVASMRSICRAASTAPPAR